MNPLLEKGARQGLENMLGLKPGERVCIVTDIKKKEETENTFVEVAKQITDPENVIVYILEDYGERPLKQIPGNLVEDAKKADVTMFIAESIGEELETVRKPLFITATKNGAAHGHCPGFTREMMLQGMATDYNIVYALSHALFDILSKAHRIITTSEAGTNLIVDRLVHFPWVYSQPIKRGKGANLPDGEIFCYPYNVFGTAVIDGCVGDIFAEKYGDISKSPVYINIHGSRAIEITCPKNKALEEELNRYVMNLDGKREFLTSFLGEFALGTNLGITGFIGNMLQDEKCGRASHFAFGDPIDHHGSKAGYTCKGHIDNLMMNPTVKADGVVIMDKGQYVEMVLREAFRYTPTGYMLAKDGLSFIAPDKA